MRFMPLEYFRVKHLPTISFTNHNILKNETFAVMEATGITAKRLLTVATFRAHPCKHTELSMVDGCAHSTLTHTN